MNKQPMFRKLAVAVMAAFAVTGTALAADEIEPNGSIAQATPLTIGSNGSVSVNGVIGTNTGMAVQDVDFFSFDAKAGDVVTIMINGGIGGLKDVDTQLYLFIPGTTVPVFNDDPADVNPGSTAIEDARIDKFEVKVTGTYIVAVTGLGVDLNADGSYSPTALGQNGDYTLIISGLGVTPPPVVDPVPPVVDPVPPVVVVEPPVVVPPVVVPPVVPGTVPPVVLPINIDIKPGNGERTAVIRHARGDISVALLSSAGFNALDTDVKSLTFGVMGYEASLKKCERHGERVDRNRSRDLVCHFRIERTGFAPGTRTGVLKGKTRDGRAFEGRGAVMVVEHHGRRDDRDDDRRGHR